MHFVVYLILNEQHICTYKKILYKLKVYNRVSLSKILIGGEFYQFIFILGNLSM